MSGAIGWRFYAWLTSELLFDGNHFLNERTKRELLKKKFWLSYIPFSIIAFYKEKQGNERGKQKEVLRIKLQ